MSGAQYGERGGSLRTSTLSDDFDAAAIGGLSDPVALPTSSLSPRLVHFSQDPFESSSGCSSAVQSLTSASTLDSKLDLSPTDAATRRGLLSESFFSTWKDDAAGSDLDSPEEMQKKDPLATQIWRLYSKTKAQLPNAERMENLTWRMMSMNLRRQQLERKALVPPF
jgi:GATA-binding protein, other eukaryote